MGNKDLNRTAEEAAKMQMQKMRGDALPIRTDPFPVQDIAVQPKYK